MTVNKSAEEAIDSFEFMRYSAEARAYSKISQERPLTKEEIDRYREVCRHIGISL